MKEFKHVQVTSFEQAAEVLKADENARVTAGGTDLIGGLKHDIYPTYPTELVNLKAIPDTDYVKDEGDVLAIGALAKLADLEKCPTLKENTPALVEAAHSVATPIIRNLATIGGNICQEVRCWYYRYPNEIGGRINCARKEGKLCYAEHGRNQYHSVFGGMKVRTNPCQAECPAGTDIAAYMDRIRANDWDGAVKVFMQYNPMPMITSRVCPHPCQDQCNQCSHGDSVNIHGVERSLGDYILAHADEYYVAPTTTTGKKVAIIGAGPGGLTAAYYLRKAGNEVVVFDRMEKAGGVLTYGIPHYRLPKKYVEAYVAAIEKMGVEFKLNTEVGKDVLVEDLEKNYDALYLGTGAWKQPVLGIEGENLTEFGLNFLVEVNTYLQKVIGEEVLVCGGGNVAMDVALTAVRLGAKKVKLVCLEQRNEMPAASEEVARALEEGVEIYNGWGLGKVLTDENGKACGLESMKCTSVRDEAGRFAPTYDYDTKETFASDCIILATGQRVDVEFLGEFGSQLKSTRGLLEADAEEGSTRNPKVFAGGDAVTGPNIAIRAIRTGRNAARNINMKFGVPAEPRLTQEGFLTFDNEGIKPREMNLLPERPVGERTLTDEDTGSFTTEAAVAEARRCMNCGCYSVNASDISPVLMALGATVRTTERDIPACEYFANMDPVKGLRTGELVKEVRLPKKQYTKSGYLKLRVRNSVDFAITSLAYAYDVVDGKFANVSLVAGGVAPVPVRLTDAEAVLCGKECTCELVEAAMAAAVAKTHPLAETAYKVNEVKALLKEALTK